MLKIAICDDDVLFAHHIASALEKIIPGTGLQKHIFSNSDELLLLSETYDIALLDVDMDKDKDNGIELAKRINSQNPACKIIFVSGYLNFATEVYESEHVYFVLKTDLESHLPKALEKAVELLKKENSEYLLVEQKGKIISVKQKEIMFFERRKRMTDIVCSHGVIFTSEPLSNLETKLFFPPFCRCHNSYIVNFAYISHLLRTEIRLHNGSLIPVSRAHIENTKILLARFVGNKL